MQAICLQDIEAIEPMEGRLAVLGDPIAHSLSPAMHSAALQALAGKHPRFASWSYLPIHVPSGGLGEALQLLYRKGFTGLNLTIPHKIAAFGCIADADAEARQMGAVNTLVHTAAGYVGHNTDGYGILQAIWQAFGPQITSHQAWIFGAGGAARGILFALLQAGFPQVSILNRSPARLQDLQEQIRNWPANLQSRIRFPGKESALTASGNAHAPDAGTGALLINATSLGLHAEDVSPIAADWLRPGMKVYDTTYGCRNHLRRACAERGVAYADGMAMLVWQGVRSLEIWSGEAVDAACMAAAAAAALNERQSK